MKIVRAPFIFLALVLFSPLVLAVDTDNDGMSDGYETNWGLNPNDPSDRNVDLDGDKLSNYQESTINTNPKAAPDADGDGMPNHWELYYLGHSTSSLPTADADSDTLTNLQEFTFGSNPASNDTDGDGMPDGWEVSYGLNLLVNDAAGNLDGDYASNVGEYQGGTNPTLYDVNYLAAGALDITFGGGDGWVSTEFLGFHMHDQGPSAFLQQDGKLVVAGYSYSYTPLMASRIAVARFNIDGSLDTTFDGDGKLNIVIGEIDDRAFAVTQQADGKLVLAGYSHNGTNNDFAIVRLNTDGTLDTTFDADGIVTKFVGPGDDRAMSVIQQADGKLVVAGYSTNGQNNDFAIIRLNADGSSDTSFDGDGKLTTDFFSNDDQVFSLIQQADGKLVAAGTAYISSSSNNLALARYNSDGSLDVAFSGDGKVTSNQGATIRKVIQQSDGKLVGVASQCIFRYDQSGMLDVSFDGDGKACSNFYMYSVLEQTDNKLVVSGDDSLSNSMYVARYSASGVLDNSFDGDGKKEVNQGRPSQITSVFQQADGRLIVGGTGSNNIDYEFGAWRFNTNGSFDTTYDSDGYLITNIGIGSKGGAQAIIQQTDGKLVAAGAFEVDEASSSPSKFSLSRYTIDGDADTGFDSDGLLVMSILDTPEKFVDLIQQPDGKLVAVGSSFYPNEGEKIVLARYLVDGSLDVTFDGDGKVDTIIGSGPDIAYSLIQQSDGKLVVTGQSSNGANTDMFIVRYLSDGSLDSGFDGDGILTVDVSGTNDSASSIIQQADGKLVISGYSYNLIYPDFIVMRFNQDGSPDETFGSGGMVITSVSSSHDMASSVIQQFDGKLVVVGFASNGGRDFAIVRYNPDGSLDTSFDGDGKVITNIGLAYDEANSVIQQSDGKLVVAGSSGNISTSGIIAMARYHLDGTLDMDFDSDGILTSAIFPSANSIIQQMDGMLVVAGSATVSAGDGMAIARFGSGQLDTDNDGLVDWLDTDNDGDGMPNDWEQTYGLNPLDDSDAAGDLDSDGFTNLQEYENSTDPTVAESTDSTLYDFDNDGDGDVLLRNPATGENNIWLLENGAKSSVSTLTTNATTFDVAAIIDGDNDGDADILWYDSAQGKLIFWQMENGLKQANAFLGNTTATLDGVGDFDGDGDPDILLKTSTGSVKIWTLNNLAIVLSTTIGTPANGYSVIDTGDFNGDGIDDIVMQNAAGAVRIWQLNASAQLASTIDVASINTAYSLKKSGDTDNDGDDDLVFRNDTTGQSIVWEMENSTRVVANTISGLNPAMSLATVTDFDKDGDEDLMFRDVTVGNASDGDTIIWKMQDNVKQSNSFLGNNAVTFLLESTLDMDGDGDFDILYRDSSTGQILGWNMENGAKAGNYNLGNPGLSWEPRF